MNLPDRIKKHEQIYRQYLPTKQYFVIRCDGRSFGQQTRHLDKPFDNGFIEDMQQTAIKLFEEIQGAQICFAQSDEISIVFTDLQSQESDIWFGGNIQKIVSIAASICTAEFNKLRNRRAQNWFTENAKWLSEEGIIEEQNKRFKSAQFDARVFSISQRHEVLNYLLHRQQDCSRNSIQMMARSVTSHKECENKNCDQLQELIFQKSGQNWNNLPTHIKRGSCVYGTNVLDKNPPIFSQDWEWFNGKIL